MATFRKLKKIKAVFNEIPGVRTYKDFDILIEIGYHQEIGQPLTLKQLLLLGIASRATVCRHLDRLSNDGIVIKSICPLDQRTIELTLESGAIHILGNSLSVIASHFMRDID